MIAVADTNALCRLLDAPHRTPGAQEGAGHHLAAAYGTEVLFATDRRFRMIRPLTGHPAFRLLPDDL